MQKEFKFRDYGDKVFFLYNGALYYGIIVEIKINFFLTNYEIARWSDCGLATYKDLISSFPEPLIRENVSYGIYVESSRQYTIFRDISEPIYSSIEQLKKAVHDIADAKIEGIEEEFEIDNRN